jgi:hypothetical protein
MIEKEQVPIEEPKKREKQGEEESLYCPIIRVQDIRRLETLDDDWFSEDEESDDELSTLESVSEINVKELEPGVRTLKKSKEDKLFETTPNELILQVNKSKSTLKRIMNEIEFQVLVEVNQSKALIKSSRFSNTRSSWIDDLKDFAAGMI